MGQHRVDREAGRWDWSVEGRALVSLTGTPEMELEKADSPLPLGRCVSPEALATDYVNLVE